MPVFCYARAGCVDQHCQFLLAQQVETLLNRFLAVINNGLAVRRLVAGGHKAVQSKRIIFRSGALLFQKATENTRFG